MTLRLAIVVSHPIQHFAPWHRELARQARVDLKVFFCCDWGVTEFADPDFGKTFKWDIPLLEGYEHEFMPIAKRPEKGSFLEMDNPEVGAALSRFDPDVVKVFGYGHRTHWRATRWARRQGRRTLVYSDSNWQRKRPWYVQAAKEVVVRDFYRRIDGAYYVGDNNRDYHRHYGIPDERLFPGMLPIDRERLLAQVPDRAEARRRVRERHGVPDEAFVVAFCGKFIPRKRAPDLVEAVAGLGGGERPVWALLIGDGPERGALERLCEQKAARNVVVTGFVNQTEVPSYLASSDAIAVTSAEDPHPLVVTEGSSFGLPVLASDAIGCVGEGDTARADVSTLVYPCGDAAALRAAIERLRSDPALHERLSSGAIEISKTQDVSVAASTLADAAEKLYELGPRA